MKAERTILVYALTLFTLLTIGCAKPPDISTMEPEPAFRYLQAKYADGDYLAVIDGLDMFTLKYSGSALVDSAECLLAMAHFQQEEYLLAAETYKELAQRFPRSPLVPEAMYQAGFCYYKLSPKYQLDQEYTEKAISTLQEFIDYFPGRLDLAEKVTSAQKLIESCREKLARKMYESATIYTKMDNYESAKIYLQMVMDKYYDTDWAAESTFKMAEVLQEQSKTDEAITEYRVFISKYSDHPLIPKAKAAVEALIKSAN